MGIFRLFEGPENVPFWLKKGILYFKILFFLSGGLPLQLIPVSFQDENLESSKQDNFPAHTSLLKHLYRQKVVNILR